MTDMDEAVQAGGGTRRAGTCSMSIFIDHRTRLLVQGITGRDGSFHTRQMAEYGTSVVAGVTPGKGGQVFEAGSARIPIFNTVASAVEDTGANVSVIYVPPVYAADAMMESAAAGIPLVVSHHGRRAGSGHDARLSLRARARRSPHRSQLPRTHHARRLQGRDHPGSNLHTRFGRPGEPLRYADLRSRRPAHACRLGTDDLRRDRRRSDQRDQFH